MYLIFSTIYANEKHDMYNLLATVTLAFSTRFVTKIITYMEIVGVWRISRISLTNLMNPSLPQD